MSTPNASNPESTSPDPAAVRTESNHATTAASASVQGRTWVRIQAISGLVFLVFASLHLLNTTLATLGPGVYNRFQRALRPMYQSPGVEILLVLAPIAVHMVAGIARMRQRTRSAVGFRVVASPRQLVHRYAGYFLMVFVAGHVAATRLPVLLHGAYPEFEGVAFTFQFLPLWFYPYYTLLALAGFLHAALGTPLALGALRVRVPRVWRAGVRFWTPTVALGALLLLGVAAMSGLVYDIPDHAQHPYARVVLDTVDLVLGRANPKP